MRSRFLCPATIVFTVASIVAGLGRAHAQEDARAQAQQLLREGRALFERREYQAALDRFREAEKKYPSPLLQFNIGQALRLLGRHAEAAVAYQTFLAQADASNENLRAAAEAALRELRPHLGRLEISAPVGAEIRVDGRFVGRAPFASPSLVAPGSHEVLGRMREGEPVLRRVSVAAGALERVAFTFAPPAPLVAPRAPEPVTAAELGPRRPPREPAPPVPLVVDTAVPPPAARPSEAGRTAGAAALGVLTFGAAFAAAFALDHEVGSTVIVLLSPVAAGTLGCAVFRGSRYYTGSCAGPILGAVLGMVAVSLPLMGVGYLIDKGDGGDGVEGVGLGWLVGTAIGTPLGTVLGWRLARRPRPDAIAAPVAANDRRVVVPPQRPDAARAAGHRVLVPVVNFAF